MRDVPTVRNACAEETQMAGTLSVPDIQSMAD